MGRGKSKQYTGSSNVQFSAQIPNSNVAVDCRMYIELDCEFVLTVGNKASAGTDLVNTSPVFTYAGTDTFQSFPINRMCQSAVL